MKIRFTCPCGCNKEMSPEQAHNSTSRFTPVHITNECGVREAFEGFYWRARWENGSSTFKHNEEFYWPVSK